MEPIFKSLVNEPDPSTAEPYFKYKDNQYVDLRKAILLSQEFFEINN
jgi:hypothetical protein